MEDKRARRELIIAIKTSRSSFIQKLLENGYTYSQIGRVLSDAVEKQLVSLSEDHPVVTDKGLNSLVGEKNGGASWMEPKEGVDVAKKSKHAVYLPRRHTFLSLQKQVGR